METIMERTPPSEAHTLLRAAVSDVITAGLSVLAEWLQDQPQDDLEAACHDPAIEDAAALLGIPPDATVDEIRAAFRRSVKDRMAGGRFHDQHGGTTDDDAQQLIAAKNALLERARSEAA
jgi:hypothetical protein